MPPSPNFGVGFTVLELYGPAAGRGSLIVVKIVGFGATVATF